MFPSQHKQTARLLVIMGLFLHGELALADDYQGLAPGDGRDLIIENCIACHSTKIILQNRMTRQRWDETITWMQKKQGLRKLGKQVRGKILNYLARTQGVEGKVLSQEPATPRRPAGRMYLFDYPPNRL